MDVPNHSRIEVNKSLKELMVQNQEMIQQSTPCKDLCFMFLIGKFAFLRFRLCSLTITRLTLLTPLPPDLTSLSLAVKMQSSKRTLRSHEITVPPSNLQTSFSSGGLQLNSPPLHDSELDLHFTLQYPHFLKRDGNR